MMQVTFTPVFLTDDELELLILALEDVRRLHLDDYDAEVRAELAQDLAALARKLHGA